MSAIKKNPENWILFLFQFAENKVGGSVNQRIKKVWPYFSILFVVFQHFVNFVAVL